MVLPLKTSEEVDLKTLTKDQLIDALHRNLTAKDQQEICEKHTISRATYYRTINKMDLSSPITAELVERAQANKTEADARQRQTEAGLRSLT